MIDKIEEIQATFAKENLRFAGEELDTIIGTASNHAERFTIKGPVDGHELQRDQRFSFYGRWANYTNKRTGKTERQFHFKTVVPLNQYGGALNQYGSIPGRKNKGWARKRKQFFVESKGKTLLMRPKGRDDQIVVGVVAKNPVYKKRFPFYKIADGLIRRVFPKEMNKALKKALATAR